MLHDRPVITAGKSPFRSDVYVGVMVGMGEPIGSVGDDAVIVIDALLTVTVKVLVPDEYDSQDA